MSLEGAVLTGLFRDLALTMCHLRRTQFFDVRFLYDRYPSDWSEAVTSGGDAAAHKKLARTPLPDGARQRRYRSSNNRSMRWLTKGRRKEEQQTTG
jgi:hypothetical protein